MHRFCESRLTPATHKYTLRSAYVLKRIERNAERGSAEDHRPAVGGEKHQTQGKKGETIACNSLLLGFTTGFIHHESIKWLQKVATNLARSNQRSRYTAPPIECLLRLISWYTYSMLSTSYPPAVLLQSPGALRSASDGCEG